MKIVQINCSISQFTHQNVDNKIQYFFLILWPCSHISEMYQEVLGYHLILLYKHMIKLPTSMIFIKLWLCTKEFEFQTKLFLLLLLGNQCSSLGIQKKADEQWKRVQFSLLASTITSQHMESLKISYIYPVTSVHY